MPPTKIRLTRKQLYEEIWNISVAGVRVENMYLDFLPSAIGEKYFFRQRLLNNIPFKKKDALLFSRGAKSRADFA